MSSKNDDSLMTIELLTFFLKKNKHSTLLRNQSARSLKGLVNQHIFGHIKQEFDFERRLIWN